MKWSNPGHQLDELGERYLKVKNLYIYGVDEKAKKAYNALKWLGIAEEFCISFVQDITVYNQESEHVFCEKPIIPFQTVLCDEVRIAPGECVVALPWIAQTCEREILEQIGLTNIFYLIPSHNRCDNFIQNFVCVWLMYKHGKLLSHWTNFVTTLKCNLNCKHCLNFNDLLKDPQHVTFEVYKDHIDTIFSKFDYLYSLHFTGGEPMLVKDLPRFIRYLLDNYKDRIFEFFVISNATIMPTEETLSAVKEINGSFLLDDYSATVPNSKLEEIERVLKVKKVDYSVNKVESWYDLDFENTDNSNFSEEELECYKDSCNSCLHEFAEKRIYACCYQQYANRAGIGTLTENDYIDIATTSKMEILEFRQGYTKKGYIDFCKQCKGIGCNAKKVEAAVQMPRKSAPKEQQQPKKEILKDTVSICVPIYNTGKYLNRCIDSLIAQTYSNLEIVLVDDGSTDNCSLICDDYAKQDSRVVVVHQNNKGEAGARNTGLHTATGEYVMFIDSDDEYRPNAVQLLIDGIKNEDVDLAMGGYIEKRGQIEHFATGHQRRYTASEIAHAYLTSDCLYAMPYIASTINAKLFRRQIIIDNSISYDERFVIGNDAVFMCEYLKYTRSIYDVFAPIYVYYKFQPEERIQGMAWYYPDGFFLFAYVADRMIKIAKLEEIEYKQLIIKQYKDFLYALVYATANKERFNNGILPYLVSFCRDIDLLQIGAKLDLTEDSIKKEDGALPIKLISFLIINKRYDELYELFKVLARERNAAPYQGDTVRQMIRLKPQPDEENAASTATEGSGNLWLDDKMLVEQVNGLVVNLAVKQRKMDDYEAQLNACKAEISACKAEISAYKAEIEARNAELEACKAQIDESNTQINSFVASTSWRVTKPLRAIKGCFRKR